MVPPAARSTIVIPIKMAILICFYPFLSGFIRVFKCLSSRFFICFGLSPVSIAQLWKVVFPHHRFKPKPPAGDPMLLLCYSVLWYNYSYCYLIIRSIKVEKCYFFRYTHESTSYNGIYPSCCWRFELGIERVWL